MNDYINKSITSIFSLLFTISSFGQVGVGTTNVEPSAKLQIESTEKGLLPPRMTTLQRDAIVSPANGLIIFNTTTGCIDYFFSGAWRDLCGSSNSLISQYATGSVFCSSGPTSIVEVTNPITGKIWMDRNLGATRAATSSTDTDGYGDLYQWGRKQEGHQCRNSATIVGPSNSTGKFIIPNSSINDYDWRSTPNNNLWSGVTASNNPCPSGFRIPTEAEWASERASWAGAGGINSPLRLPSAGMRTYINGTIILESKGFYWTSTVSGSSARYIGLDSGLNTEYRSNGLSVRCIKN